MYYNIPCEYKGITNVQHNFNHYFDLLTNKACNLFVWEGLPETVDERSLNIGLILKGKICWTEFNGKLYALTGNLGGEPNSYYLPTEFIIANPVLGSKQVKVRQKDGSSSLEGLDGILMGNSDVDLLSDRAKGGLFSLIYQYAGLLADNVSSLNVSQINGRVSQLWTADNEAMARTAEVVLKEIYEGKPYKIVSQDILDKVGVLAAAQSGQSNTLLNLMEIHQFFLAQFYSELGIAAQGNLKRERINTAETELMTGSLDINVWNMLENRRSAVEQINELFGTSISVELNPEIFYPESSNATLGEVPPEAVEAEEAQEIIEEEANGFPEEEIPEPKEEEPEEKEEKEEKEDDA